MMFVQQLRQSVMQGREYELLLDGKKSSLLEATHCMLLNNLLPLHAPSGYKSYSCWSILYFYENNTVEPADYIASIAALGDKLPVGAGSVGFMDRKDLLDYITGVSTSSIHVKSTDPNELGKGVSAEALLFGFDLEAKKALLPSSIQQDIRVMKQIRAFQRTINTPSNILCVRGVKNFASIEKPAFNTFASMKAVKKLGSSSRSQVSKKSKNAKSGSKDRKIIIIPAGAQSLLTLFNAKDFFGNQKFIPSEEMRKKGIDRPLSVEIERDVKKLSPFLATHAGNFLVYDSVDSFSTKDWSRVVAVFATGQEWQFNSWPKDFKEPVKLFSRILGYSLRYQDEPATGMIPKWNVKQLQINRNKRYLDSVVVHNFWQDVDKYITQKYHE